jgi:hypothetical protein
MIGTIALIAGAIVLTFGEFYGIFAKKQTISGFVWSVEARWPAVRILVAWAIVWLFHHLVG